MIARHDFKASVFLYGFKKRFFNVCNHIVIAIYINDVPHQLVVFITNEGRDVFYGFNIRNGFTNDL